MTTSVSAHKVYLRKVCRAARFEVRTDVPGRWTPAPNLLGPRAEWQKKCAVLDQNQLIPEDAEPSRQQLAPQKYWRLQGRAAASHVCERELPRPEESLRRAQRSYHGYRPF